MTVKFYLNLKLPVYLIRAYAVRENGKLNLYRDAYDDAHKVYYFTCGASMSRCIPLSDDNPAILFASRKVAVKHAAAAGIYVDSRNNVYDRCKLTR